MDNKYQNHKINFFHNQNIQESSNDYEENSVEFSIPERGSSQHDMQSDEQIIQMDQGFQQNYTDPEEELKAGGPTQVSQHINLIQQLKYQRKKIINNLILEDDKETETRDKIVAEKLGNIYKHKAEKNFTEAIKGAVNREIKRQEEAEERKLNFNVQENSSDRNINFNPSNNHSNNDFSEDYSNNLEMMNHINIPAPNIITQVQTQTNSNHQDSLPLLSMVHMRSNHASNQDFLPLAMLQDGDEATHDNQSSLIADVNYGVVNGQNGEYAHCNPKFDDEMLLNNSDDEDVQQYPGRQEQIQQNIVNECQDDIESNGMLSPTNGSGGINNIMSPKSQTLSKQSKSQSHQQIVQTLTKTFGEQIAKVRENKDVSKMAMKKKLREMKNDIDQYNPEEVKKFQREQLIRKMQDESQLSLRALKDHIRQNHCKKNNEEWWDINTDLGSFFGFNKDFELNQALRDIGLGPSLYLLTLKALGKMFLVLTILNIPCMYFFFSGTEHMGTKYNIFQRFFASVSLGNLGEFGPQCHHIILDESQKSISLSCQSGTLDRIDSFGLSSQLNQRCDYRKIKHSYGIVAPDGSFKQQTTHFTQAERDYSPQSKFFSSFMPFDKMCSSYQNALNSKLTKDLENDFKIYCKDEQQCIIDFNYEDLNEECTQEINKRIKNSGLQSKAENSSYDPQMPDPEFFIISTCKNVGLRLMGTNTFMQKETMAILIVIIDIISMIFVLCFINILQHLQRDFSNLFDINTIEVRDFAIKIDQLPQSYKNAEDEIEVKFKLWKQIQEVIQDAKDAKDPELCPDDLDSHIVDIQFGMRNYSALNALKKLQAKCIEVEKISYRMRNAKKNKQKLQYMRNFETKQQQLMKHMEKHKKDHGDLSFQQRHHQEGIKNQDKDVYQDIQVVYVTFLSMEAKNLVFDRLMPENGKLDPILRKYYQDQNNKSKGANIFKGAFNQSQSNKGGSISSVVKHKKIDIDIYGVPQKTDKEPNQTSLNNQFNIIGQKIDRVQHEGKKESQKFGQRKMTIKGEGMKKLLSAGFSNQIDKEQERLKNIIKTTQPVDPEFILWDNIGYTNWSRKLRKCFSIFIAFTIIGFSFFVVMQSNEYRNKLMGEQPSTTCEFQPTKFQAYEDIMRPKKQRQDYMACFCYSQLVTNYRDFFEIDFTEFGNNNLERNFCYEWLKEYSFANFIYRFSFLIVVLINLIAQEIFILVAKNEKQIYSAHENQSIFEYIFYQSFINIGIILIFTDLKAKFLQYGEFDTFWYIEIGSQLCFTMIVQNYTSKGGDIFRVFIQLAYRFYDRGFSQNLKNNIESEDQPNTNQLRQKELEDVYTGPQIKIGHKMSYTFTFIFVGLSYSSGLPIMYPSCFLYFFMTYWFDKVCILRFYQRSKDFNEELPIKSVSLMKYAVMIHFVFSIVIYSSSPLTSNFISRSNFSQDLEEQRKWIGKFYRSFIILLLMFIFLSLTGFLINIAFNNCFQRTLYICWHSSYQNDSNHDQTKNKLDPLYQTDYSGLVSKNFYGEILFDYLLTYYESTIYYVGQLEDKYMKNEVSDKAKFQEYIKSSKKNLKLMEKQIDFYYDFLVQKIKDGNSHFAGLDTVQITELLQLNPAKSQFNKSGMNTVQLQNNELSLNFKSPNNQSQGGKEQTFEEDHLMSPHSNCSINTNQKIFLEKLEFLDSWFDEDGIHQVHLKDNLRCATFIQSYNILDNPEYQEADGAYDRATLLTENDFFIKDIEYDSSSDESSSQASDESQSNETSSVYESQSSSINSSSLLESIIDKNEINKSKQ